ncbi:MAG: hypothetical protein US89_C0002G0025 [Candidatus Peregrinibacteria bacterium GW2011_GWF2_38_29]|nr:MAG: hypothetical protein US89_C0002G0025 [Candidatus Peregrinibacteria bacterium GW2011_GWF2_38_29]HBB02181.1 hypothetical protein [Candidatus Peregrinibacteria bacterium]
MVFGRIENVGITETILPGSQAWRDLCRAFYSYVTSVAPGGKHIKRKVVRVSAIIDGVRIDDILCAVYDSCVRILNRSSCCGKERRRDIELIVKEICDQLKDKGLLVGGAISDFYYEYREEL